MDEDGHREAWIRGVALRARMLSQRVRRGRVPGRRGGADVDALTGLADRSALERTVQRQVAEHARRAARSGVDRRLALVLLDLNNFKQISAALGHRDGDRVLASVAERIARASPGDDAAVARLGGDEFAVAVSGLRDVAEARQWGMRLLAALDAPVPLDGLLLDASASAGVAVYPEHGTDFGTLLRHAEVAMYDAKSRGDRVAMYTPESDHHSRERLVLLTDLRRCLDEAGGEPGAEDRGGITLYYQPQIELCSGRVVGVEALLRWHHPRHGWIDPEELIRIAEGGAVMRLLTQRVLDMVIGQLAAWGSLAAGLRAAVNVSVRDVQTGEIVDRIARRLDDLGVDPAQLQVEITEGSLMADARRVLATLTRLRRLGVAVALDDFGTGYSSLLHVRRLPITEVKIDRSFVLGVATNPDDHAIVRSVIELTRALGLRAVAEGVEDDRSWRALVAAGCDVGQGWFFARPMPAEQFAGWLAGYRPRPIQQRSRLVRPRPSRAAG